MSNKIRINASKPYDVIVGNGILPEIGMAVRQHSDCGKVAVICDDTVSALYGDMVCKSVESCGMKTFRFTFPHGEDSKNVRTLTDFLGFMADSGLTRSDAVIALGGGVTGDIGGLAASLYMRGICYIQVPTTLLAMTDSSVGGKTAVDIAQGKNLIGAFYQPSMVWCDIRTLATLPHDTLRDGFAEVVKYGILFDGTFFDKVSFESGMTEIVTSSIRFKAAVVEADERDTGQRALLNLGHTIGHAIEKLSGYSITHGTAVAAGLYRISLIAAAFGLPDCSEPIRRKLTDLGFDLSIRYEAGDIYRAALSDKKCGTDEITLILPERIGKCGLYNIGLDKFAQLLEQTGNLY